MLKMKDYKKYIHPCQTFMQGQEICKIVSIWKTFAVKNNFQLKHFSGKLGLKQTRAEYKNKKLVLSSC